MTVRYYRHTDAGAPSLNNVNGSLVALLNACLVTGYGSQSASGWTMPFTGTNTAVFRQPNTANEMYLKVDEVGVNARIYGYENMTSLTVGTGKFPTEIQVSGGLWIHKAAGSTPVPWFLLATDKVMYLTTCPSNNLLPGGTSCTFMFGDIESLSPGDRYNTMIIGGTASDASRYYFANLQGNTLAGTVAGHYIARSWSQVGTSLGVGKFSDVVRTNNTSYLGSNGGHSPTH